MEILYSILAFIVTISILVVIHEAGHFSIARLLGVRVERFSVGFGPILARYQHTPQSTEFALSLIPLGGYVAMLDERVKEVPEALLPYSFNRKPLWKRMCIILAGPAANLLLAVVLYTAIFMHGEDGLRSRVSDVVPGSIAAQAGFQPDDDIVTIDEAPVQTWQQAIYRLSLKLADEEDVAVGVVDSQQQSHVRMLPHAAMSGLLNSGDIFSYIGIKPGIPDPEPRVSAVEKDSPAALAGVHAGDLVTAVNSHPVKTWSELVASVRMATREKISLDIRRQLQDLQFYITPELRKIDGKLVPILGLQVQMPQGLDEKYQVRIKHSLPNASWLALQRTWETSIMTFSMMYHMVVGQVAVTQLSGPIGIAQAASNSAEDGVVQFTHFLALISISLGILNLLPIPMLDGGHLLYGLIEWLRGRPLSESQQLVGQKIGIMFILFLMFLAFYADIFRLMR